MKKRTLACEVGTYGLRGWMTSDTPVASKLAPSSSGRCAVAEAGSLPPMHVREVDAGLLEHGAFAQHARFAAAAFRSLPAVVAERRAAVGLLQGVRDAVVQVAQVRDDDGRRWCAGAHPHILRPDFFAGAFFFAAAFFLGAAFFFTVLFGFAATSGVGRRSQPSCRWSSRPSCDPSDSCRVPAPRRAVPGTLRASAISGRDPSGSWRSSCCR